MTGAHLVWAWARSRSLHVTATGLALLAIVGHLKGDSSAPIPYFTASLPLSLLGGVVAPIVATWPLQGRFATIEKTLVRSPVERAVACGACLGLVALADTFLVTSSGGLTWEFAVMILAVTVASTVVLGSLAWMATMVVGCLALVVDRALLNQPVTHALEMVGLPLLLLVLVAISAAYVGRGARDGE